MGTNIENTYEGIYLVEYVNSNPNGDFNAGGAPSIDPIDGRCRKSCESDRAKIRRYWATTLGLKSPYDILHRTAGFLEREDGDEITVDDQVQRAREAASLGVSPKYLKELEEAKNGGKKARKKGKGKDDDVSLTLPQRGTVREEVFRMYLDARVFGAMLNVGTDPIGGCKGPFVINDGVSLHPVIDVHQANTRQMVTREKEKQVRKKTVGNRVVVRYALMQSTFTLTPGSAYVTGMSMKDFYLTLDAMINCWTLDTAPHRRGVLRGLWLFKQPLRGRRPVPHDWTDIVRVECKLDDPSLASSFRDFNVTVDKGLVPKGVEILDIDDVLKMLDHQGLRVA
jgi:CRISPR-associated protein Csd2